MTPNMLQQGPFRGPLGSNVSQVPYDSPVVLIFGVAVTKISFHSTHPPIEGVEGIAKCQMPYVWPENEPQTLKPKP